MRGFFDDRILKLPQRCDVVQNPETATVGPDAEIVTLDNQIANGSGAHVQPERLPMVAIIERHIDSALSAGEEQSFAFRVFADSIGVFVSRNAAGDFGPVRAAVVRAIDMRSQIIEPQSVDGRIGSVLIEMTGLEN